MRDEHERVLESTNAGHYFSECSCGGSFGVFPSRKEAAAIHAVHAAGSGFRPAPPKSAEAKP